MLWKLGYWGLQLLFLVLLLSHAIEFCSHYFHLCSHLLVNMLRNGASRLALRSIATPLARSSAALPHANPALQWATQFSSMASKRPQSSQIAHIKPVQAAIFRRNLTDEQKEAEKKYAHEKLKVTPDTVSASSTTHPMFGEIGGTNSQPQVDMMAGVKDDVVSRGVSQSFSLS